MNDPIPKKQRTGSQINILREEKEESVEMLLSVIENPQALDVSDKAKADALYRFKFNPSDSVKE